MIRVLVELWPFGNQSAARTLGEAFISNDGSGSHDTGNYNVRLMKSPEYAKKPGIWKKGQVENFPRLLLGPWDLLYRALRETVGSRNKIKPWESSLHPTSTTDTPTSSTSASGLSVQ